MKIYYVRHGQSMNNIINDLSDQEYEKNRQQDPSLSEQGIKQVRLLTDYLKLKKVEFEEIRCSPQQRAIQTAQLLSEGFKVPLKIQQNLHEKGGNQQLNKGFPGLTRKEFQNQYPGFEIDELIQDAGWYFKDKRETDEECTQRAEKVLQDLQKETKKSILIIGHGNFMDQVMGIVCGRAQNSKYFYYHQNCGITLLKNDGYGFEIDYYNDYSFLDMHYINTGEDLLLKRLANYKGKI
ncbi:unnamed protein product [Paramecium octaurelia]|uniref:Phosphoglycerate mutase n=1 Tax=Paramecium octaurelia TaxID=43137 RepID=A0A8S1VFD5_PAROT|nr:unnamed protein product [Paramecium octaurelia]